MNKNKSRILILAIIVLIISKFAAGIIKPLWIDEIVTLWQLESTNLFSIVEKFYLGYDTHPPLYFFIASILTSIFGESVIVLKVFSFLLSIFGVLVITGTLKKLNFKNEIHLTILIIVTAFYFSNLILSELRPYALYFFISTFVIRDVVQILIEKKYNSIQVRTIIYVLFLYTHYYSILYLGLITLVLFMSKVGDKKNYLPFLIALVFYSPWLFAIFNQLNHFQNSTWHFLPSIYEIIVYPISFFRYTTLIYLPILFAGFFIFRNEIKGPLRNIIFALLFFPYFNILLYYFGIEIYSFKYIIPSFIAGIIIFPYGLKTITSEKIKTALIILLLVFGAARVYNQINWSLNEKDRVTSEISYDDYPILCESPLDFAQLKYYGNKVGNAQIFYPIINDKNQNKKQKFENIWFNILDKEFLVQNISTLEKYLMLNQEFYLIPSDENLLSDILISKNYSISKVNYSRLLRVSHNSIND